VELRLLQRSKESDRYSLHRLVGEVRRGEIPLEGRLDWVDAICSRLGDWFQEKKEEFSHLTRFESEINHLKSWQENALRFAASHASRLMWLQAYPAYHRGRFHDARNSLMKARRIFHQVAVADRELQASLLNDIAYTDTMLGQFSSILTDFEEALRIRRELFGERHEDIARTLENIAWFYGEQENWQRALDHSQQALAMRRALFC
jgi:tetratricopeptide (TPR) repeat protein